MTKIAFVIPSLSCGGAERATTLLASYFVTLGIQVDVIILFDKIDFDCKANIISIACPPRKTFLGKVLNILVRKNRLERIFKKNHYDRIYAMTESSYIPALMTSFPVSICIHNTFSKHLERGGQAFGLKRFFYISLLKKARKVVVLSKGEQTYLDSLGIKNTVVIPNAIDIAMIDRLSTEPLPMGVEKPYILACGRLVQEKRFDYLINCFSDSHLSQYAKLVILGSGDQLENLKKTAELLNINEKIIFKPEVSNPFPYMKDALFLVLSSSEESFSYVIVESLICGKTVISTRCQGPKEIIDSGVNGLLVDIEDKNALTQAMDLVYFDSALREYLEKNARKSAEKFSIEKIAERFLAID